MKRVFTILLGALLLSCNNGDIELGTSHEIAFNATHMQRGAMTQADVDNTKVYVYGVQNTTDLFTGTAITRDAATGRWFPSTKKSWTQGSSYSFYGYTYSPSNATSNGLTLVSGKNGLEVTIKQPTTYNESAMIDYLVSYAFKVADGAMKPIVQLHLEHTMTLVEVYVVRGNKFDARLKSMSYKNIYSSGTMKCTSQAVANSGDRNIWQVTPSGENNVNYSYTPASAVDITDSRETTNAKMSLMCIPQQLTASTTLTIVYEINEKTTADGPDNWVEHTEEFKLYNYNPMDYESGHKVVYTATIDSGVNFEGVVKDWIDVDYIEGTVLPEID